MSAETRKNRQQNERIQALPYLKIEYNPEENSFTILQKESVFTAEHISSERPGEKLLKREAPDS